MATLKETIKFLKVAIKIFPYNELIKSGASFLDLPVYLIALIASKLDLLSPTTTKPIIPILL